MKLIAKSSKHYPLGILLILLVGLFVGSVLVGLLVENNPFIKQLDGALYVLINHLPHNSLLDQIIWPLNYNFLPTLVPSFFYFMFAGSLTYLLIFRRSLFLWAIFCFVAGTFLAGLITTVDWHFVFRQRPFETWPSTVDDVGRAAWKNWSSYPSGHTRETTLYTTIIAYFIPQLKYVAIVFIILMGFMRVYIGAHYPTDVLAGGIIGYGTARVILIIARELQLLSQKILKHRTGGQTDDNVPVSESSDIVKN